ncbi:hypothetical protein AFE_2371 [Acidithiobacillus ferrooxidans ATCC 23270]|uniref:Uncharacterized protein n=1 Tax=Acidithiobacillus ferrooxidans (strain ATCC 23270 / DSM 14882 / CIP 104768 / NCIMB 8455) TaxID=243159 RepID=B7J6D5_ACIF2|nr:hypothetical protein AFE_2371 [Acidithiobacillus ferrooxidans ATCC 23270]
MERGIENVRRGLRIARQTAEQYLGRSPWILLVGYIIAQITKNHGRYQGLSQPLPDRNCFCRVMATRQKAQHELGKRKHA